LTSSYANGVIYLRGFPKIVTSNPSGAETSPNVAAVSAFACETSFGKSGSFPEYASISQILPHDPEPEPIKVTFKYLASFPSIACV